MNHLEEAILNMIELKYGKRYNAGIKVTKNNAIGYELLLDLGIPEKPLHISIDTDDENVFLKYIEKELIRRLLHKTKYFREIKIDIEDELRGTCRKNGCSNK